METIPLSAQSFLLLWHTEFSKIAFFMPMIKSDVVWSSLEVQGSLDAHIIRVDDTQNVPTFDDTRD